MPRGEHDWVLRVVKPEATWPTDLVHEARLLDLLGRGDLGAAIPGEVRVLRDSSVVLGALHRIVEGTLLVERLPRGRKERAALASDLAVFLGRLHAVPASRARRAGVAEVDLWDDRYVPLIEAAGPRLGPATSAWLTRTAQTFARGGGSRRGPSVLVHGDFSDDNVLVDVRGRLAGVIDFGDAMVADPAIDFAAIADDLGEGMLQRVLAAYPGEVDADLPRRARFYRSVSWLYAVVYGDTPAERAAGVRGLAARAAASTRRGATGGG
jgi:aminoglycoside phosphotransferase (APT) family kinase protein